MRDFGSNRAGFSAARAGFGGLTLAIVYTIIKKSQTEEMLLSPPAVDMKMTSVYALVSAVGLYDFRYLFGEVSEWS